MIFDSQKQKTSIIEFVQNSPVQTTVGGVLSGPSDELVELWEAMKNGEVRAPQPVDHEDPPDGDSG